MDLQGRIALVTGGGTGISRATCLEFARAGVKVAVVDVNAETAAKTVSQITQMGGEARSFRADVTRAEEVKGYVEGTLQAYGRIDALFNNAGIEGVMAPLFEYPEDIFDRVVAVNLKGTYLGLKDVLPVMLGQKSGSIINASSILCLSGAPAFSAYVASKHAVLGLTRTAAAEVGQAGIRINAVCPGLINTRMIW